ncbi:MAG: hypothetical protein MJ087_02105 [Lachnospiraceae bacterium]|nr:hypothetical protein [Lachnospiraceae bacterium]
MRERIQNSYKKIAPCESEKDRMLQNIMNNKEETNMRKLTNVRKIASVAVMVLCLLVVSGTTYAGVKWYQAKQIAERLGEKKLARYFGETNPVIKETGAYRIAFLGVVSGKNISSQMGDVNQKKTYAAVAVERKDGQDMTEEDVVVISPFVKGVDPQLFNIYTLNGGAISTYMDGIYYGIADCTDLEIFADRGVYLGVMDGPAMKKAYIFDQKSGEITSDESYKGLNALFKIPLDKKLGDEKKAQAYLSGLSDQLENDEAEGVDETNIDDVLAHATYMEGSRKEVKPDDAGMIHYVDKDTGLDAMVHKETVVEGEKTYIISEDDNGKYVYVFEKEENKYFVSGYKMKYAS